MQNFLYGSRIKTLRKEKGYTQRQLSKKASIGLNTLRRYEADMCQPKIETLSKIAKALEIDSEQLILEHSKEMYHDYVMHPEKYTVEITKDGKQYFYINEARQDTIAKYDSLNALGQKKANEYITDLSEQEKYTTPDEEKNPR